MVQAEAIWTLARLERQEERSRCLQGRQQINGLLALRPTPSLLWQGNKCGSPAPMLV